MSVFSLNAQYVYDRTAKVADRLSRDLCEMNTLIMGGKIVEAFSSIADVFFSVKMPCDDNFRGAVKTLKGWSALGSLPRQVMMTAQGVYNLAMDLTFNALMGCVSNGAAVINKAYDAASFLEKQIAIPFFAGVTDLYRKTNFQAVGVGATIRFVSALPRVEYSSFARLQAVESAASMVLAGTMLAGGSSQLATAASATGAFAKGLGYFSSRIF